MIRIEPLKIDIIKNKIQAQRTKEDFDNGDSEFYYTYSFNVDVNEKYVDVFNKPFGSGNYKKILYLHKGVVVNTKAEMISYNIGHGWVKLKGFYLENEKDLDNINKDLQIYKY